MKTLIDHGHLNQKDFRRGPLVAHIGKRGNPESIRHLAHMVKREGVNPRFFVDAMVGDPENTTFEGRTVTMSSVEHAFMANTIVRNWASRTTTTDVVEIGGGFGGLCWSLSLQMNVGDYAFVDNPACLAIQNRFIYQTFERYPHLPLTVPRVALFTPEEIERIKRADLVMNTRSFGEMDYEEVSRYVAFIERILPVGGAFYTVNWVNKVTAFDEIPLTEALWRPLVKRNWPTFIDKSPMIEALYHRVA